MFSNVVLCNLVKVTVPLQCVYCWTTEGDSMEVVVLYPERGVTKLQKLQLLSVQSDNVSVVGAFCIKAFVHSRECC